MFRCVKCSAQFSDVLLRHCSGVVITYLFLFGSIIFCTKLMMAVLQLIEHYINCNNYCASSPLAGAKVDL